MFQISTLLEFAFHLVKALLTLYVHRVFEDSRNQTNSYYPHHVYINNHKNKLRSMRIRMSSVQSEEELMGFMRVSWGAPGRLSPLFGRRRGRTSSFSHNQPASVQ